MILINNYPTLVDIKYVSNGIPRPSKKANWYKSGEYLNYISRDEAVMNIDFSKEEIELLYEKKKESEVKYKEEINELKEFIESLESDDKKELASIEFKTLKENGEEKRIWVSLSTKLLTPLKPNFKEENKYFKEVNSLFNKQPFFRVNLPETKTVKISVLKIKEDETKSFTSEEIPFFEFNKILKANTQEVKKWVDDHRKDLEQEDSKEIEESLIL